MDNEFYDIPGFEFYEINKKGEVRSKDRTSPIVLRDGQPSTRRIKGRILKVSICSNGYPGVCLSENGIKRTKTIHRLLASIFVANDDPSEKILVCHNDGDTNNFALNNLRWDTVQGNVDDKVAHGTHQKGECSSRAKLSGEQAFLAKYGPKGPRDYAQEFGVTPEAIHLIRAGKNWSHL